MTQLEFSQVIVYTFDKSAAQSITVPSGKVWKIESAGLGGSNGSIFLRTTVLTVADTRIAILFSTIRNDDFSSPLPYWLPENFTGSLYTDTADATTPDSSIPPTAASVSISEYDIVTTP
jgi:hypothetical protein